MDFSVGDCRSAMKTSEIQVAVISSHGGPCSLLRDWLALHRLEWWASSTEKGIDLVRNQAVTRFLREDTARGKRYLLSINGDHVPIADTQGILREPGDVVWCGDVGHWGSKGHFGRDTFGCGCFRASAEVLAKMRMPWFSTVTNSCTSGKTWEELQANAPDKSPPGTRRIECECNWFARHLHKIGVKPRMVGIIGNQQGGNDGCILFPDPTSSPPWKIAFPCDLRTAFKSAAKENGRHRGDKKTTDDSPQETRQPRSVIEIEHPNRILN